MKFEKNTEAERWGKKVGFVLAFAVFIIILYGIVDTIHGLEKIKYLHILGLIGIVAVGRLIKK